MLLLNAWDTISDWATNTLTDVSFWLIVGILTMVGLLGFVSFVKKSYAKEGKIKWSTLIVSLIVFGVVAFFCAARYA